MAHVYRPMSQDMVDFERYVEFMLESGANDYGLAKIIPPKSSSAWSTPINTLNKLYKDTPVEYKGPFFQQVTKQGSLFVTLSSQMDAGVRPKTIGEFRSMFGARSGSTYDLCEEFWQHLTEQPNPIYANDNLGTLFDGAKGMFELNNFNDWLTRRARKLEKNWVGVISPYLYLGSWRSHFPIHTEDMDLFSINYLHEGSPKYWYGIYPADAVKVENIMKSEFRMDFEDCPAYFRHKNMLIPPEVLIANGIRFTVMKQEVGEYIVTFPRAYHQGFNGGFNIAEAVNFAPKSWTEYGIRVTKCVCDTYKAFNFEVQELLSDDEDDSSIKQDDIYGKIGKKTYPCAYEENKTQFKLLIDYLKHHYRSTADDSTHKQTRFKNWVVKKELAGDVIENCGVSRNNFLMNPVAIGKVVRQVFEGLEDRKIGQSDRVYGNLKRIEDVNSEK